MQELTTKLNTIIKTIYKRFIDNKNILEGNIKTIITKLITIKNNDKISYTEHNASIDKVLKLIEGSEEVNTSVKGLKEDQRRLILVLEFLEELEKEDFGISERRKTMYLYNEEKKKMEEKMRMNEELTREYNMLLGNKEELKLGRIKDKKEMTDMRFQIANLKNEWVEIENRILLYEQALSTLELGNTYFDIEPGKYPEEDMVSCSSESIKVDSKSDGSIECEKRDGSNSSNR